MLADIGGEAIGGAIALVICGFGIILAIYWAILPLILVSKFNKLLAHQADISDRLSVMQHQLTVLNNILLQAQQPTETSGPGV